MSTRARSARLPWTVIPFRRHDRRQGYRIDPAFQSRFRATMLGFSVGILLMTALLVGCVLYVVENPSSVPQSPWVPASLFALAAAIGGIVFHLADRISHRYCGPVHRISRTLEAIERGERPEPIRLRRNDELHELATVLNDALRKLGALDDPR